MDSLLAASKLPLALLERLGPRFDVGLERILRSGLLGQLGRPLRQGGFALGQQLLSLFAGRVSLLRRRLACPQRGLTPQQGGVPFVEGGGPLGQSCFLLLEGGLLPLEGRFALGGAGITLREVGLVLS